MDTVRARHNFVTVSSFLMCRPERCQFQQRSAKGHCKWFSITASVRDDEWVTNNTVSMEHTYWYALMNMHTQIHNLCQTDLHFCQHPSFVSIVLNVTVFRGASIKGWDTCTWRTPDPYTWRINTHNNRHSYLFHLHVNLLQTSQHILQIRHHLSDLIPHQILPPLLLHHLRTLPLVVVVGCQAWGL